MEYNELVGVASIGMTVAFGVLAWYLARVANRISLRSTEDQYFGQVVEWAASVVVTLEDAIHLCSIDPERSAASFYERRLDIMSALAAQLDHGRWFFPNLESMTVGVERAPAFRGYRQEILNLIAVSYTLVKSYDYTNQKPNWRVREELVNKEREFASIVQLLGDPRKRQQEFKQLVGSIRGVA